MVFCNAKVGRSSPTLPDKDGGERKNKRSIHSSIGFLKTVDPFGQPLLELLESQSKPGSQVVHPKPGKEQGGYPHLSGCHGPPNLHY